MNNRGGTEADKRYFRERLTSSEQHPELQITYTIHGGAPSEELTEEIVISGEGDVSVHVDDELGMVPAGTTSGQLDEEEVKEIFQTVEDSLPELITRSEAQFVPGSLVGSITLETDEDKQTFYFEAEEAHDRADTPDPAIKESEDEEYSIQHMIRKFTHIEKELLGEDNASKR